MYEEPPPLPFPSLPRIKHEARTIFEHYRHPATPELDIRFYEQESSAPTEQKRPRAARACDSCRAKKVKCDNNLPQKPCGKQNCSCEYHVQATEDSDNERTGQNEPSGSSSGPQDPKASQDMIPSTTVFRKPGLMYSGHFAGETSFCAYLPVLSQPPVLTEEDEFPTLNCISSCPYISPNDQLYLLETYYTHLNPFYPILNKDEMKKQLNLCMNGQKCYLSPLFFYALFARAAHIADRTATEDNHTFEEISQQAMAYAINLRTSYQDRPRVSTVLALIILANQLEQTKVHDNLTRSWLLAGEAFRLALDMGIHRSGNHDENDNNGQFCIRTFWLAYITDCTMSMTYGRPSATEEKVLDVTVPKALDSDDSCTKQWVQGLNSIILLSKIAARVIKFNYCPPPPFKIQGPVKRHNAFLASVDSWLTDIMYPSDNEPESPISSVPNVLQDRCITDRFSFQKKLFLLTNLILLHRPYVNDTVSGRSAPLKPSNDICTYAATIITYSAYKMDPQELIYHSKSPMTVYSLVMALRVHLMNAASANPDKSSADKSCTHGFETLRKLPQCQNNSSMLYDALIDLEEMFNNRQATSIDREDDNMHQRIQQQHVVTAAEVIFAPGTTENRKAGTISPKQEPETPVATPNATMAVSMPYRHYKPHQNNKKRKKGSHDDVDTSGPSQMHVFDAGPSKQKGKGKQKNKIKRISPQDTPDPITTTPMAEPQNQPIYTNNFITADPSSLQYANLGIGNFNTLPLDTSCSFIPNDPIDFSNEYIMQLMLLESANFDLPQNDMATDLLNFYDVNHSNDAVSIRLADQQPYTQPSNVKYQ